MRCAVLLATSLALAQCQFRFNLGDIFNPNRNRGNENENQNQDDRPRVDAGAILGGLLGAVTNPNRNQNNANRNPANNILGGIVNAVVSEAIENTDVNIGVGDNGQLQVAVLPKDRDKETENGGSSDDLCVDNGSNTGSTGIRNGPNVATGDCVCWDRGFDYRGADLPIGRNPSPADSAQDCQRSCQNTNGCTHWTFRRKGKGRRGRDRAQCWRKSSGFDRRAENNFISGPARCGPQQASQASSSRPSSGSRPTSGCTTIGGGDPGASCAFPFIYRDVEYRGCILVDADDNIPWCSTLTDRNGNHVGGQGKWGHCPPTCNIINEGSSSQPESAPATSQVAIEGSQSQLNNIKSQLPWFPSDGKLTLSPQTVASNNIEGTTANDIANRFLALGLNQPNTAHQTCRAPGNERGSCRHLHHCLQPVFANIFNFFTHLCIIQGRYIGVCCPEPTTTTTTTPAPTPAPQNPTSAPTRECGTNAKRFQTRIVGGRPADPDEWPWLAALVHKDGRGSGQYCGATLISDTHVLTAAHCIKPFKQSDIRVKLGEYDFEQEGETKDQTFTLASMKIHERYDDVTFENDIAILKLNGVATRSESVWPICLPPPDEQFTNRRAFVIGWGTIYFGGPVSNTLQEVNVRVWENSQCAANYAQLDRNVIDTMLCAGETNRDSCQGDSGGPLNCMNPATQTWELCGVVSWGARCAEPDFPGVYTRVTKYLSWIRNNSR